MPLTTEQQQKVNEGRCPKCNEVLDTVDYIREYGDDEVAKREACENCGTEYNIIYAFHRVEEVEEI